MNQLLVLFVEVINDQENWLNAYNWFYMIIL